MERRDLIVVNGRRHRATLALLLFAHVVGAVLFWGGLLAGQFGVAGGDVVAKASAPLFFGSVGGLLATALSLRGAVRIGDL